MEYAKPNFNNYKSKQKSTMKNLQLNQLQDGLTRGVKREVQESKEVGMSLVKIMALVAIVTGLFMLSPKPSVKDQMKDCVKSCTTEQMLAFKQNQVQEVKAAELSQEEKEKAIKVIDNVFQEIQK